MKPLICYHKVNESVFCPDGIFAAAIAAKSFNYKAELVPLIHQDNQNYLSPNFEFPFDPIAKTIIILDFAYPANLLSKLAADCSSLIVLDHHEDKEKEIEKFNLSNLSNSIFGLYSPNELDCGSTLAWKFFFPKKDMPLFLEHVRNRDTGSNGYYEGQCIDSEYFNIWLSKFRSEVENNIEKFDPLYNLTESDINSIIEEEKKSGKLEERNALIQEEIASWDGKRMQIKEYNVPFLKIKNPDCDSHYSMLGTKFHRSCANEPFVVVQCSSSGFDYSLRSHADSPINLGPLANRLGGGGHRHAAGFRLEQV